MSKMSPGPWYVDASELARRTTGNQVVIRAARPINATTDVVALMAAGSEVDAQAIAKVPAMVAMLRKLAWAGGGSESGGDDTCPRCHSIRGYEPHSARCELAALLKDLPEEP